MPPSQAPRTGRKEGAECLPPLSLSLSPSPSPSPSPSLSRFDSISTWFGILALILLRSSGPKSHNGPAACT